MDRQDMAEDGRERLRRLEDGARSALDDRYLLAGRAA
jgi:hypothetical protein